ncbi:MAG: hypothetical protein RL185_803 [Bacteroidota bacterium]
MSVPVKNTPKSAIKSILNYEWIVVNISFFLFLAVLAILYIANGQLTDKTIRKINTTKKEIKQLQFEYKTLKADLMLKSESINIEKAMAPYGLQVSKEMSMRIPLEKRFDQNNEKNKAK